MAQVSYSIFIPSSYSALSPPAPPFASSPTRRATTTLSLSTFRSTTSSIRAESASAPAQEGIAGLDADPTPSWYGHEAEEQQSVDPHVDRWWESQPSDKQQERFSSSAHTNQYNGRRTPSGQRRNWYLTNDFVNDLIMRVGQAEASREGIENALEGWREPLTPRNIVKVISRVDGWQKAFYFFEWLKSRDDYDMNTYIYNVVMKALQKGKQWQLCEQLAEEMIREGFVPDNFTYSILINCAKRCNLPDKALEWFQRMNATECVPDQVTYNCILDVLGSCGRMEEAVKLYEQLRKSGWQPDSVTCGTMANVFAKMDDHWAIEKLYWDMKEIGVEPNVVYYNTYIQALSRSGRLTLAANTFKQMEEAGIQPTSVTLTILIEMYTRVGAIQKAFEVFERLQREGLVVDVIVYNSLISACAEHSLVTEAESLFDRIYEQGSRPNEGTYRCMMSVYASKGMVKEVRDIFEWLEADGYSPGSQAYTSLIRACKQGLEFDKVPEYFNEMISRGCVPNEWLCGSLLACFSMCKPGDVHRSILDCVKRCNPKVHDIVEKFLGSQHVEADWLQEKLANVISEFQLDTRRPLLNSLIDICWQAGRMRESYQILRIGRSLKVYENLETFLDSEWRLNLRTLSFSSAECALESWLNSLYVALYKGQKMPTLLVVETGSGKRRTVEKARLNGFIYSLLKKMDAPFEEDESEIGIFKATCSALKPWLESRKGYPLQDFVGFRHEANTDFHDLSLTTF